MPTKSPITKIIKQIGFLTVSVAIVFGTFYYENSTVAEGPSFHAFSGFDYKSVNEVPNNGFIRFDQDQAVKQNVSFKQSGEKNEYIFDVESGHFWVNFAYSDVKSNFVLKNIVLIPSNASFDLQFDGEKLSLAVFTGDVYLGFLDEGISIVKYEGPYSEAFMNRFLVPIGNRVDFNVSRVDEKFKLLLPSKILKEIKYRAMSTDAKDGSYSKNYTDWVKQNLRDDRRQRALLAADYKTVLIDKGIYSDDGLLSILATSVKDFLTFVPQKKEQRSFGKVFGYLNDAMFYAAKGDFTESGVSLNKFDAEAVLISTDNEKYEKLMTEYIAKIILMKNELAFSAVFNALMEKKMDEGEVFYAMDGFLSNVYESLDSGEDSLALSSLSLYYAKLAAALNKLQNPELEKMYFAYQHQLLHNLFLKYSLFYKDDYFQKKGELEQKFFDLMDPGQIKDEWMLSFIRSKIEILIKLQKYFFEEKVEINEARKIVSRVKDDIQNLLTKSSSDLAVLQIFEKNLDDVSSFWGFLNTPEYYASNSYGSDYAERYEFYLKERTEIWSFIEVVSNSGSTGNDVTGRESVTQLQKEITAVFEAESSVASLEIGEIRDVNQSEVSVKFAMEGYPVEAIYDINKGTIKDVRVYGEVITLEEVRLKGLYLLIEKKFAVFNDVSEGDGDVIDRQQETNAQIILKRYLANKISESGFKVTADNIKIIDESNAICKVEGVYLDTNKEVECTFTYEAKTEKAIKVYLIKGADVREFAGPYTLEQILVEVDNLAKESQNDFN